MTPEEFNKRLDDIVPAFEAEFLSRVADKTPVSKQDKGDVGRLKRGWSWDGPEGDRVFSNEAPYASFVEFGTWKMAPTMMVGTTLVEVDQILADAVKKAGL
jgi:hypothetical protein